MIWPTTVAAVSLAPPTNGVGHAGDEEIVFVLGPGDPEEGLSFEINDVDVTGFVVFDGSRVALRLPMLLEPGVYDLRVLHAGSDGSLAELGVFSIEIRESAAFREMSWQASATVQAPWRIGSHGVPTRGTPETQVRGALQARGEAAGEDWSASIRAPIAFDHDRGARSLGTQRDWDLGGFLVETRRGNAELKLGHHQIAPASLIMEGFQRRGVSAGLEVPELRSRITGWSLFSEPITGFREGLGVSERDQRVSGVTIEGQPLEFDGGVLDLAATWLHGHGTSSNFGSGLSLLGPRPRQSGTAWSVRGDVVLSEARLRVRGEYARSRFDPFDDALGSSNDDDALSLLVEWRPWEDQVLAGNALQTQLAYEHRRVGPNFRSVANPGAPIDRRFDEVRGTIRWGNVDVRGSLARERDNVDSHEELPNFRTDRWRTEIGWMPSLDDGPAWLGSPSLRLMLFGEQTEPLRGPNVQALSRALSGSITTITNQFGAILAVFPGAAIFDPSAGIGGGALVASGAFLNPYGPLPSFNLFDRAFQTASLDLSTRYSWGNVSLSHTVEKLDDRSGDTPDSRADLTAVRANFRIGEKGSGSFALQRQIDRSLGVHFHRTDWFANASLRWRFWEDLSASLTAAMNRSKTSDDTQDMRFTVLNGRIDWTVRRPEGRMPGFGLSLHGSWTDRDDRYFAIGHGDTLQVFLEASLTWQGGSR